MRVHSSHLQGISRARLQTPDPQLIDVAEIRPARQRSALDLVTGSLGYQAPFEI